MFTKKHFEAVAGALRSAGEIVADVDERTGDGLDDIKEEARECGLAEGVEVVAHEMARVFAHSNPRFNKARFLRACGVLPEEG